MDALKDRPARKWWCVRAEGCGDARGERRRASVAFGVDDVNRGLADYWLDSRNRNDTMVFGRSAEVSVGEMAVVAGTSSVIN